MDGRHIWSCNVARWSPRRPAEIIITHPGNLATDWEESDTVTWVLFTRAALSGGGEGTFESRSVERARPPRTRYIGHFMRRVIRKEPREKKQE